MAGLVAWAAVAVFVRAVVALPEHCPPAPPAALETGIREAVGWLSRNQQPDGSWVYRYNRRTGATTNSYDLTRHAGAIMALYQAALAGFSDARPVAEKALSFALDHLVDAGGGKAFWYAGQRIDTGATALLAVSLTYRAQLGDHSRDALLPALGRFLQTMQGPNGVIWEQWDPASQRPDTGHTLTFFTGESLLAWTRMAALDPSGGWEAPARLTANYIEFHRDHDEHLLPTSDHWASYAIAEQPDLASDAFATRLAGILSVQVRFEAQRTDGGWGSVIRGPLPLGAGMGALGEALAALTQRFQGETASPAAAALARRTRATATCVAGILLHRQESPAEAARAPQPERARGAWFTGDWTQLDDQQHTLSTLIGVLNLERAGATGGGS